jgi:plastocyanin
MNDVSEGSMRFAHITHWVPAIGLAATLGAAGVIAVVAGVRAQSETAVTVQDFAFAPKEASVPAGSSVTWTNRDRASHTITSNDNAWDSARLAPGSAFTLTLTKPGTYTYRCGIHPGMKGTLVVGSPLKGGETRTTD